MENSEGTGRPEGEGSEMTRAIIDDIVASDDLMNALICGIIDRIKEDHDIRDSLTSAIVDSIEESVWIESDATDTFNHRLYDTLAKAHLVRD